MVIVTLEFLFVKEKLLLLQKRCGRNWKTNVARGAVSKKVSLPSHIKELALKSASVLDLDYAGIDIVLKNGDFDDPYLIEVNSIPGWHGLQQITDFNIAEKNCRIITSINWRLEGAG